MKIRKVFISRFFTVTALSDFILSKRCKFADVLVTGDHRRAMIEYKYLRVRYKVELFQSYSESFSGLSRYSRGESKFLIIK